MDAPAIAQYLKEIENVLATGRGTEHSYRPALQKLLEACGPGIAALNEPKRVECGAPDFFVARGAEIIGFVEAKDLGKNLAEVEKSEQMTWYLDALPNLILTDYLSFRWYQIGKISLSASLGAAGPEGRLVRNNAGRRDFALLIDGFLSASFPAIASPHELAARMAGAARLIRDVVYKILAAEKSAAGSLHAQLEGFRKVLLHDLEPAPFADMYAQTICYGMFAARYHHQPGRGAFTREAAAFDLPETNPFLREMFSPLAGPGLDDRLSWSVNHLAEILNRADLGALLQGFGRRTRREDPIFHFYETFLAAYDPGLREKRGVYYTPEPVVSYMVRSVDHLLRSDFGIGDGLASAEKVPLYKTVKDGAGKPRKEKTGESHRVLILDPAAGTGAFLYGIIDQIHQGLERSGRSGMWDGYVAEHLLPRLFGFELLMAPYAVAHMKLSLRLAETGYRFQSGERLRVYLTNTLEEAFAMNHLPLFASLIAREASEAVRVKTEAPVMVVLGNPPYSGHSANTGHWISAIMRGREPDTGAPTANYFAVDGGPLKERNPKWLNDDYVKFIRFAQWRIERTGFGILAFITNHGYLDNPTFRGMRQALMQTFDDIYVLDLHGNANKKEKTPDGGKDENVFDIKQGVAIGIFVRKPAGATKQTIVRHADLWGVRETFKKKKGAEQELTGGKYRWLYDHDLSSHKWTKVSSRPPFYPFVPMDGKKSGEYQKGWGLHEAMPVNSVGIVTARDHLTVHFSAEEVWATVKDFSRLEPEEARRKYQLSADARDWKVKSAQADLIASGPSKQNLQPILYRPFDRRFTYYTGRDCGFICRPRTKIMRHLMSGPNLGLQTCRQTVIPEWRHVLAVNAICDDCYVSNNTRERGYILPLYLYPDPKSNGDLFGNGRERRVNFAERFLEELQQKLKLTFSPGHPGDLKKTMGPEDVFHYIYAVLHAPTYRERYAAFLKSDFPRVPLTSNLKLFRALARSGRRLAELHLSRTELSHSSGYPVPGDNRVEKTRYDATEERVYINAGQYFSGVPQAIWEFRVGGYQVCEKWLKDRKGRVLAYDDLTQYHHIVAAIGETMEIMGRIDRDITDAGGWPLA